jgi:hypothetical protein
MASIQRKVEVYTLTISGLPEGTGYGKTIRNLRGKTRLVREMVMKNGDKYHALNSASLQNHRLRLQFLSYTEGHRPPVIDTNSFNITENPLTDSQTFLEWTHVLGAKVGGVYTLLIERNTSGIWPTVMERYFQWLFDEFYAPPDDEAEEGDGMPVTVAMEAQPGDAFMERIEKLDRITEATVRIHRPNPGWADLESELGALARASQAERAEVKLKAPRKDGLASQRGIMAWIREKFSRRELGWAAIEGKKGKRTDRFNTEKLNKHFFVNLEVDKQGQIQPENVWNRLGEEMDRLGQDLNESE